MNFIVGDTGITPALTVMRAVILAEKLKNVSVRLVFCNKTPADILCQEELEEIVSVAKSFASVKVCHVISHVDGQNKTEFQAQDGFLYENGLVNGQIIKKHALSADDSSCFMCGPPAMIAKAVLPALTSLGFDDDQIFEF